MIKINRELKKLLLVTVGIATISSLFSTFPSEAKKKHVDYDACGVERWSIKTGTDPNAMTIDLNNPTKTTIADMTSWQEPTKKELHSKYEKSRLVQEMKAYTLDAKIVAYKKEEDSDYHIVLREIDGNRTMIAEIPSPDCVGSNSPFLSGINKTRKLFDENLKATNRFKTSSISVTITGVGFFDFKHKQRGLAPNGIELHPLLDITFK
jgi:hypothetical protein